MAPAWGEGILALAGFCLIYLQFFMIREVTALLQGTEIVILLVTIAYFIGYSVGYAAAGFLTFDRIRNLALPVWLLHLTLPFSFRYLGGIFDWATAAFSFVGLLFLTAFALSSFYSILLPRFIDQAKDGGRSLARYYSVELLGAVCGVLALMLTAKHSWLTAVVYQAALATLIALLWGRPAVWAVAALVVAGYALVYPIAEGDSLSFCYRTLHGLDNPKAIYSVNTLYQKVDILQDENDQRFIYLSGRMNYGSGALGRFNVVLSQLPARLVRPREALIIGSGSMESVKYVSALAEHVTTAELDLGVIEGSRRYLASVNHLADISNWTLVINDGKAFLGSTDKKFDLVVMDVPAPTTIQLGLIHSVEFYELVRSRLTPHGVISVSLSGRLATGRETPLTVASALLKAFPEMIAYNAEDAKRGFAVAGNSLPFSKKEIVEAAEALGSKDMQVFSRAEVADIVGNTAPMTADNMRLIVARSWRHVRDSFRKEASE